MALRNEGLDFSAYVCYIREAINKKSISSKEKKMNKNSNIVAEAKADAKAKRTPREGKPWYINLIVWLMDALAAVAILALAIQGALSMVQADLSTYVKIGVAILVVGLLASRLLERVFQARR